jgi:hypothetical protein
LGCAAAQHASAVARDRCHMCDAGESSICGYPALKVIGFRKYNFPKKYEMPYVK